MSSDFFPPAPPPSQKSKKQKTPSIKYVPTLLDEIPQFVYSPEISFHKQKSITKTKIPEPIIRSDFDLGPVVIDNTLQKIPSFPTSIKEKNHKPDKWYKKWYNKIKNTFSRKNKNPNKVVPIGGRKRKTKKQRKSKNLKYSTV